MKAFSSYVEYLEARARSALGAPGKLATPEELTGLLNGGPSRELRRRVSDVVRQKAGAFFTGTTLRDFTLASLATPGKKVTDYWDPTCGAGDLLLGAAAHLPVTTDIAETLKFWGARLHGSDLHPEFIRAARARLVLAAYHRGARHRSNRALDLATTMRGLRQEDTLAAATKTQSANVVLANPPFGRIPAPAHCDWASGGVSAAAVFMDRLTVSANPGTRLIAILPDVLRSGSRYQKWRELIQERTDVSRVAIWGRFDSTADVDVFVLDMVARASNARARSAKNLWQPASQGDRLGDHCSISVGPVVPHRNIGKGNWAPLLRSKDAKAWSEVSIIPANCRFVGPLMTPPFVVVKRTSSPSDRSRAAAAVVRGERAVAVENHLIVLQPTERTLAACKRLLDVLKRPKTNEWLNQRIRCRHLTVTAISEIPWLP